MAGVRESKRSKTSLPNMMHDRRPNLESAPNAETCSQICQLLIDLIVNFDEQIFANNIAIALLDSAANNLQEGKDITPLDAVYLYKSSVPANRRKPDVTVEEAGRWMRSKSFAEWWEYNQSEFTDEIRRKLGVDIKAVLSITDPEIVGRGNRKLYSLAFESSERLSGSEAPASSPKSRLSKKPIHYTLADAKSSLGMRWLLGRGPIIEGTFRWRLAFVAACCLLLIIAIPAVILLGSVVRNPNITPGQIVAEILLGGIWITLFSTLWPRFAQLQANRIMIARAAYLRSSAPHGQLELVSDHSAADGPRKLLRFVRYTARCPSCNGTVDLMSGGPAFHGRIVGRCSDNPAEHVYSFSLTTRTGELLTPTSPKKENAGRLGFKH